MSFENYKINNFSQNQMLSYQDLNNLALNDVILYNKIQSMPRGVIAFSEIREPHGAINNFTAASFGGTGDEDPPLFLKINQPSNPVSDFSLSFSVEDLRLVKFSFYAGHIDDNRNGATYNSAGQLRFAFFLSENGGEEYMLSSTYKTSALVKAASGEMPLGSISMHHVDIVPAGTHTLKVGLTARKATVRIGREGGTRPTQLYVEDLGGFIAPGDQSQDLVSEEGLE